MRAFWAVVLVSLSLEHGRFRAVVDPLAPTDERKQEQEQTKRAQERKAAMMRCMRGANPVFAPSGTMTVKQLRAMFAGECTPKSECMQRTGSAPFDLHGAIVEFCKNGHCSSDLLLPASMEESKIFYTDEFCYAMADHREEITARRQSLRAQREAEERENGNNSTWFPGLASSSQG
mmetsp:Transcript_4627/g.11186  ORF Transcript_4627/g.11186 Transcript_4627/m.11186 type:complete len:176 (+) Transcript_4627:94-621(+)